MTCLLHRRRSHSVRGATPFIQKFPSVNTNIMVASVLDECAKCLKSPAWTKQCSGQTRLAKKPEMLFRVQPSRGLHDRSLLQPFRPSLYADRAYKLAGCKSLVSDYGTHDDCTINVVSSGASRVHCDIRGEHLCCPRRIIEWDPMSNHHSLRPVVRRDIPMRRKHECPQ